MYDMKLSHSKPWRWGLLHSFILSHSCVDLCVASSDSKPVKFLELFISSSQSLTWISCLSNSLLEVMCPLEVSEPWSILLCIATLDLDGFLLGFHGTSGLDFSLFRVVSTVGTDPFLTPKPNLLWTPVAVLASKLVGHVRLYLGTLFGLHFGLAFLTYEATLFGVSSR